MPPMTALETALDFAARGWYVFPIQPGKKVPFPGFAWKELSTNNLEKIRAAGLTQKYAGCNYALDCGRSGVLVVDFDVKKRSLAEARALLPSPLDSLFTVATPSGGLHLYFSGTGATSSSKLAEGVDTRGAGGYVLIPGSVNGNGNPYILTSDGPPPPAPEWLLDALGTATEKKPDAALPVCDLDKDHNVQAAIRYLVAHAPEATQGAGGDATTYEVACRVRDLGISQDKTLELMTERWNPVKAYPPWDARDLERKVANAFRYAKDRPGNATPEALFPDLALGSGENDGLRCFADVDPTKISDRPWLLDCRYLPGFITLTSAPGGVGKSLLSILECLSIATGKKLTHRDVLDSGPVWLHNTEDPMDELDRRVAAAAILHKLTSNDLRHFYGTSGYGTPLKLVALDDHRKPAINERGVRAIITRIRKRGIRLWALDPLIGAHSVSENDNQAMDMVMTALKQIAYATNCAIGLVHHTSKGKAEYGNVEKSRGASSVKDAARIAHTSYLMDPKEAEKYGLSLTEAPWYLRLDGAKANMSAPGTATEWFKKESVRLQFGARDTTGALRTIELDRVERGSGEKDLPHAILDKLELGVPTRYSVLLKALAPEFSVSDSSMQRRIKALFAGGPVVIGDEVVRPSEGDGLKTGKTLLLTRIKLNQS